MSREMLVGLIILLIAFSSIPVGVYISTSITPYSAALSDIIGRLRPFKGEHIDSWAKSISDAGDITHLNLSIKVRSGAVSIEPATGDVLYSVDGYEGRGILSEASRYSVLFDESVLNDTLFLSINVDSGYVEVKVARDYISSMDIDMSSGVINVELSSLEDVDMDIDVSSGMVVMNVSYVSAEATNISVDVSSGFFTMNLGVSSDISVGLKGRIENGFVTGNVLGERIANKGVFTIGETEPMLSIDIRMSSGYGNIAVSKG